jgi:hypothetical protein
LLGPAWILPEMWKKMVEAVLAVMASEEQASRKKT